MCLNFAGSVLIQFDRYQKNISHSWSIPKNKLCVKCARWNSTVEKEIRRKTLFGPSFCPDLVECMPLALATRTTEAKKESNQNNNQKVNKKQQRIWNFAAY